MIEPDAQNLTVSICGPGSANSGTVIALMSAAISLKRIADMMEGSPDKLGVGDMIGNIMHAMENKN